MDILSIRWRRFICNRSLLFLFLFLFFLTLLLIISKLVHRIHHVHLSIKYCNKYPYLAVIVDDRASPLVVNAVINVLQHIPTDWKVQIITLKKNWPFYNQSSLNSYIEKDRVFLTELDRSANGMSSDNYINPILTSASFWHQVQGEQVLFFQIDSVLCSNSPWKITDFLGYDFIGAPWKGGRCCNGGLSIRNRTKILQMLENPWIYFYRREQNEDYWFTDNLPHFNGRIAPIPIAKRFSVETIYHPRPFAVHKPHLEVIGIENMTKLCNECPEVRSITTYCPPSTTNLPG